MSGTNEKNEQYKEYSEEELTALALGELDEARAAEIEQMLADDPEGLRTVDELSGVASLLTAQLALEPEAELTDEQKRAIESGGQGQTPQLRVPLKFQLRVPLSLAASILVVLGAAFLAVKYWPAEPQEIVRNPANPAPKINKNVPLDIAYPRAEFMGTAGTVDDPHVAAPSHDPPKTIYVPVGTGNLARGRAVTSNAKIPAGKLKMITDGDKSGQVGHYLDIGKGLQWVQIDLGSKSGVYAVALWHYYDDGQARAYRDVIIQVSNDPKFKDYETVFSTDHDKSAGMERGPDMGYVETRLGKVIDCKGITGRYVRLYSRGNTTDEQNHYIEVEVHGVRLTPVVGAALRARPAPTPTPRPVSRKRSKKAPLIVKYPKAIIIGTPVPVKEPNIRKPTGKPPAVAMMLKGTVNLALGKPVKCNEALPVVGKLELVTNGVKSGEQGNLVDLGFGLKWVQIDLQSRCEVGAVGVWHRHDQVIAYRDVIVQVSNDPDFVKCTTIFNSDHDNSAGMGIGEDMGYVETNHGKFIWCPKPMAVRYIRLYSKGNSSNDDNHYTEVEVYGRKIGLKVAAKTPAKAKAPTTRPAKLAAAIK